MKTRNLISMIVAVMTLVSAAGAQVKAPPQPPPEFTGVYAFDPSAIEIVSAKHELSIFMINRDSSEFVNTLRKQKYAFVNVDSRHVKCSIF